MQTPPVRLRLAPGTTAHQLMAQGMPESSAYRVLKQGWYCPGYNQRATRSTTAPGGFAHLETPERFVRAYVLRTLAQWEMAPSPDLVEDLTQEGLLACWTGAMPRISRTFRATTPPCCGGWSRSTASGSSANSSSSGPGRRPDHAKHHALP